MRRNKTNRIALSKIELLITQAFLYSIKRQSKQNYQI
ncbi:unnamed protein product [Paramecium sonneborni]|uniref:Uncharacterized protein n=1 Tax=Paramecium sonneborni TaxID=65129 RepID=A0A8S1PRD9_9CILI|nr:unnamed protein product [Paramecium sonneborni]